MAGEDAIEEVAVGVAEAVERSDEEPVRSKRARGGELEHADSL